MNVQPTAVDYRIRPRPLSARSKLTESLADCPQYDQVSRGDEKSRRGSFSLPLSVSAGGNNTGARYVRTSETNLGYVHPRLKSRVRHILKIPVAPAKHGVVTYCHLCTHSIEHLMRQVRWLTYLLVGQPLPVYREKISW